MSAHRTRRAVISTALALFLLLGVTQPVFAIEYDENAPRVADGYGADYEKTVKRMAEIYGWNTSHINAQQWYYQYIQGQLLFDRNVPSPFMAGHAYTPTGSQAYRQYSYQDKYLLDNINTTRTYMGFPPYNFTYSGGEDIVAVAIHESLLTDGSNQEDSRGSNKYIRAYSGYDWNPEWCAIFVWWCANQCGLAGTRTDPNRTPDGDPATFQYQASCTSAHKYFVGTMGFAETDVLSTKPMGGFIDVFPGDILLFRAINEDGTINWSAFGHIGIVVEVTENSIITVEGNSSNKVMMRHYYSTSGKSFLYGVIVHIEYPSKASVKLTDTARISQLLEDISRMLMGAEDVFLSSIASQLYVDKRPIDDAKSIFDLGWRSNTSEEENATILKGIYFDHIVEAFSLSSSENNVAKAMDEWLIASKSKEYVDELIKEAASYSSLAEIPPDSEVQHYLAAHGFKFNADLTSGSQSEQEKPVDIVRSILTGARWGCEKGVTLDDLLRAVITKDDLDLYRGTALAIFETFCAPEPDENNAG